MFSFIKIRLRALLSRLLAYVNQINFTVCMYIFAVSDMYISAVVYKEINDTK